MSGHRGASLLDFWIYDQFGIEGMVILTLGGIAAVAVGAFGYFGIKSLKARIRGRADD